jgi:hypothetical protein
MNRRNASERARCSRNGESGYALLLALFLILAMLAGATMAMLNMSTQGRRRREELMIWRGEQYKRAIRLYFHKTGHYPQTIDDLQKGLPDLHFLRQAYKDPMNTGDGAWRFIYVNPAGQIIGSVKYANLQQMAMLDQPGGPQAPGAGAPGLGTPASALAQQNTSSVVAFSQIVAPSSSSGSGSGQGGNQSTGVGGSGDPSAQNQNPQGQQNPQLPSSGFGQNPQQPGQQGGPGGGFGLGLSSGQGQQGSIFGTFGQSGPGAGPGGPGGTGNPLADMKPTGPVDGPVLGAFLTGVGSKVDKSSFKVLRGGKKYKDWEFIWNPLEDQAAAAQQAVQGGGTPGVALPFANPGIFGNQPGNAPGGANPGGTNPGGQQPQPQPTPQQPN